MSSNKNKRPRKSRSLQNLLIDPFKQIHFGLYMIGFGIAFSLIILAVFLMSFVNQYQQVMSIFNVIDPKLQWEMILNDVFYDSIVKIGISFFLLAVVGFILILRLTHRYYGPLVSIERFVDSLEKGDFKARIKLRKKDELNVLVSKLNTMASSLEKKYGSTKKQEDHDT